MDIGETIEGPHQLRLIRQEGAQGIAIDMSILSFVSSVRDSEPDQWEADKITG